MSLSIGFLIFEILIKISSRTLATIRRFAAGWTGMQE